MQSHETRSFCALTQPPPATRQPVSARLSRGRNRGAPLSADVYRIKPRITHVDRAIIRSYFHQHDPAGLLLRPAYAGVPFPDAHRQLLPGVLEGRLSALPPGYERMLAGRDALLIETGSRRVVDVMRDIYAAI